jgi:hypothetical protein
MNKASSFWVFIWPRITPNILIILVCLFIKKREIVQFMRKTSRKPNNTTQHASLRDHAPHDRTTLQPKRQKPKPDSMMAKAAIIRSRRSSVHAGPKMAHLPGWRWSCQAKQANSNWQSTKPPRRRPQRGSADNAVDAHSDQSESLCFHPGSPRLEMLREVKELLNDASNEGGNVRQN